MKLTKALYALFQSALFRSRLAPVLLLASVWLMVASGSEGWSGRLLLLSQFGLLLLWQPIVDPQVVVSRAVLMVLGLIAGLLMLLFGHGLIMLWLALLASLFGSRLLDMPRRLHRFHMLALSLLLMVLWLMVVPRLAGQPESLRVIWQLGLPIGLCVLAVLPLESVPVRQQAPVDYFYALLLFLIALAVPLGAVFLATTARTSYAESLIVVLILLGGGLAGLAWLWNPRAGFAGVGALFSAGMLQLGTPFERWSRLLTARATTESTPEDFMRGAVTDLLTLPGVAGVDWRLGAESGSHGGEASRRYRAEVRVADLELQLHLDHPVAPALHVQFQLIGTLLHQFYLAKVREQRLADRAYLEAIHETGARLTHDIKNLLQSLKVLVSAGESNVDPVRLNALYARQLPEITRRLETTLGKLSAPHLGEIDETRSALSWWDEARCRYADAPVEFVAPEHWPSLLDGLVFNTALDNFIQNALAKGGAAGVRMQVILQADANGEARLDVLDAGVAVPAEVAAQLFTRPVRSATGLGVGLYQVAQLALSRGWRIALLDNVDGRVRFRVCRT